MRVWSTGSSWRRTLSSLTSLASCNRTSGLPLSILLCSQKTSRRRGWPKLSTLGYRSKKRFSIDKSNLLTSPQSSTSPTLPAQPSTTARYQRSLAHTSHPHRPSPEMFVSIAGSQRLSEGTALLQTNSMTVTQPLISTKLQGWAAMHKRRPDRLFQQLGAMPSIDPSL